MTCISNSVVMSEHQLLAQILTEIAAQSCSDQGITRNDFLASEVATGRNKFPFLTFGIIINDSEITSDWLDKRLYETTWQIDAHSSDYWQAQQLAQKFYEALNDPGYRRFLKQCHMVPKEVSNPGSRNALEGVNYEYVFGFDAAFQITAGLSYDISSLDFTYSSGIEIQSATMSNQVDGTDTTVNK